MSFLDRFEQKVESAVGSVFSKLGKNELKPADFVAMLQKELDHRAIQITQERTLAPNNVVITLSTPDYDKIEEWGAATFADELAKNLSHYADTQGYALVGPVRVQFKEDIELSSGDIKVHSESVRGTVQGSDKRPEHSLPHLEINGKNYPLNKEVVIVGRGSDADIVLDDSSVSRKHFEVRTTAGGIIVADLGSTNGILVEGQKVPAATLVDGNEILVGRTYIYFRDRQ